MTSPTGTFLDDKVALVTGGARGLGREYAMRLGALGAAVGIVDLSLPYRPGDADDSSGADVVDDLRALGVRAHAVEADVGDAPDMARACGEIADALGDVAVLIANAGGGPRGEAGALSNARASEMDPVEFDRIVRSNLYGTVFAVTAVAPAMKRRREGNIVTIGSIAGLRVRPDGSHAHYAAAKAGIIHYTRALAEDLGPYGVRVNCIAPGLVATPRIAAKYSDMPEVVSNVPLGRLATPEDCVNAMEFLVSDRSAYIHGACIEVTGGTRIPWWGPPHPARDQ